MSNQATILQTGDVTPGGIVSIDQYISALPGCLPHTKGKESKKVCYHGGIIFVDHTSQFVYLQNQASLTTQEKPFNPKRPLNSFLGPQGYKSKASTMPATCCLATTNSN
jgi:hypothetical protein